MDIVLYRKVFNNKYLSNKIYDYIKFKDIKIEFNQINKREINNNDIIYLNNYKIINSYYSQIDLNLSNILNNKQYKLLDLLIDCYLKYAKSQPTKYWYYLISPNEKELLKIFKYRDLGFKRFLQLFNDFKYLLNNSIKKTSKEYYKLFFELSCSGNIEIIKYFCNEFDLIFYIESNRFDVVDCGDSVEILNHYLNQDNCILRTLYTMNYQYSFKDSLEISSNYIKFYCKNNYFKSLPLLLEYIMNGISLLQIMPLVLQINNLFFTKLILKYINKYDEELLKDVELIVIKECTIKNLIFTNQFYLNVNIILNHLFNINSSLFSIDIIQFVKELPTNDQNCDVNSKLNIYILNHDKIKLKLKYGGDSTIFKFYLANTIDDLKWLIDNYKDKTQHLDFWRYQILHATTKLYDYEFVKYILNYIKSNDIKIEKDQEINQNILIKCFNSTFEIVQLLISEEEFHKLIQNYSLCSIFDNCFFNDPRILILFEKEFPNHSNSLFYRSIELNYSNIFKYLLEFKNPGIYNLQRILEHLKYKNNNYNFNIIKSCIDFIFSNKIKDLYLKKKIYLTILSTPKFLIYFNLLKYDQNINYINLLKQIENDVSLLNDDFIFYISLKNQFQFLHPHHYNITFNKFKLDLIIDLFNKGLLTINYLLLFKSLINNIKLLIYFIYSLNNITNNSFLLENYKILLKSFFQSTSINSINIIQLIINKNNQIYGDNNLINKNIIMELLFLLVYNYKNANPLLTITNFKNKINITNYSITNTIFTEYIEKNQSYNSILSFFIKLNKVLSKDDLNFYNTILNDKEIINKYKMIVKNKIKGSNK